MSLTPLGYRTLYRSWLIWLVTSVALFAYCVGGSIASQDATANLNLTPGQKLELKLPRLFADGFGFRLFFKAKGCEQRPELGSWVSTQKEKPGLLKLTPGADVRITATVDDSPPVTYEAMPLSGYCSDINTREMTSNLSIEPGLYRWPPPPQGSPPALLHRGNNLVRLEVVKVEQPLVDEIIQVYIWPPLSFYGARGANSYFWPSLLLWPVFAISQTIWLAVLTWKTNKVRAS